MSGQTFGGTPFNPDLTTITYTTVGTAQAVAIAPTGYPYFLNGYTVNGVSIDDYASTSTPIVSGQGIVNTIHTNGANYIINFVNSGGSLKIQANGATAFSVNQAGTVTQSGTIKKVTNFTATTTTTTYTILATDDMINVTSGTVTTIIDLPVPVAGTKYIIVKADTGAGTITVTPSGGTTIEGASGKTLTTQYNKIGLIAGSTTLWYDLGTGGGI